MAAWRHLCDDGACIGVIGDDGRCRTCGRPARPLREQFGDDDSIPLERVLCPAGCIGVLRMKQVGPPFRSHTEGVCPVCGQTTSL